MMVTLSHTKTDGYPKPAKPWKEYCEKLNYEPWLA